MKLKYDPDADAAYIYLKYPIKPGEAVKTKKLDNNVLIDLDKNETVIGIEILFVKERSINLAKE